MTHEGEAHNDFGRKRACENLQRTGEGEARLRGTQRIAFSFRSTKIFREKRKRGEKKREREREEDENR